MGETATAADCLRQAEECIGLARATSDPNLKEQYLKIAGELTRLAAILEKMPGVESAPQACEQTPQPERRPASEKRRS